MSELGITEVESAHPNAQGRALLLRALSAQYAAVRARAAKRLVEFFAPPGSDPAPWEQTFAADPNATRGEGMDAFRQLIGLSLASDAWLRFHQSCRLTYADWRDGSSYDLSAIAEMNAEERQELRAWLRDRVAKTPDELNWRDAELAAHLEENDLLDILLAHPAEEIRLAAARCFGHAQAEEDQVCRTLLYSADSSAISLALDQVPTYPSPRVFTALIAYLRRNEEYFVPAAMTYLEVFAGVEDAFPERPLLFATKEQGTDGPLFQELLRRASQPKR